MLHLADCSLVRLGQRYQHDRTHQRGNRSAHRLVESSQSYERVGKLNKIFTFKIKFYYYKLIQLIICLFLIKKIDPEKKFLGIFPKLNFVHKTSYVQSHTNDFDRLAFKYLSWILFPLVVGYAIYSLIYLEHKGWYSFVLSMIYGFLLTFGKENDLLLFTITRDGLF